MHWTLEAAAHGVTGGVIAELQGGKFGHGFLSSGLNKAVHSRFPTDMNPYLGGAISAMVGGTVSELSGGKFANGAVTAAMAYAFNQVVSRGTQAYRSRVQARKPFYDLRGGFEASLDVFNEGGQAKHEFHVFRNGEEVGMFKEGSFFNKHGHSVDPPEGFTNRNMGRLRGLDNHMLGNL